MNLNELTAIAAAALSKTPEAIVSATQDWDSLDRLEIITHLHDALGDDAGDLDGLNNFNNLETLAAALKEDGILE